MREKVADLLCCRAAWIQRPAARGQGSRHTAEQQSATHSGSWAYGTPRCSGASCSHRAASGGSGGAQHSALRPAAHCGRSHPACDRTTQPSQSQLPPARSAASSRLPPPLQRVMSSACRAGPATPASASAPPPPLRYRRAAAVPLLRSCSAPNLSPVHPPPASASSLQKSLHLASRPAGQLTWSS